MATISAVKSFIVQAPGANVIKHFTAVKLTTFCNKLERLFSASLSSLVYCLLARPGAYHGVKRLEGSSIG
jgi:hypothetical protein